MVNFYQLFYAEDTALHSEVRWRQLITFSIYRLLAASFFLLLSTILIADTSGLNFFSLNLIEWIEIGYLNLAIAFLIAAIFVQRHLQWQLLLQLLTDIVFLILIMHWSGGDRSGISVTIFVIIAAAGLMGQGNTPLLCAAFATLLMLLEQCFNIYAGNESFAALVRTGYTSIGFFATAIVSRWLSISVSTSDALAEQRGIALADQMEINRRVLRDMNDGILVVDGAGKIRHFNAQAAELIDAPLLIGRGLADLFPPLNQAFSNWLKKPYTHESIIQNGNRSLTVRFLPPDQGESTLIYLGDFARFSAQAQQLKLAALGRLTASLAHEIRNPLTSINQASELLADEHRVKNQERLISIICENVQRINHLVEEVAPVSRGIDVQNTPLNLSTFLPQFIDELAMSDGKIFERIALTMQTNMVILFDRNHFHRVLWNLVTNALRYASDTAGAVQISFQALINAQADILVSDDGKGISISDQDRLFEPFFTTEQKGTGLGLYIARELCSANGASLDFIRNSLGTYFRIRARSVVASKSS